MSTRDRLNRMLGKKEAMAPPAGTASTIRDRIERERPEQVVPAEGAIEQVLPGEELETPHGRCWRTVESFGPGLTNGEEALDAVEGLPRNVAALLAGDERWRDIEPERVAYIDTETSGLAGGTGTFAFLVGVGRFTAGSFHVRQYVLRDLSEEPALLATMAQDIGGCDALVSFNGKRFDVPLLETRLRLARIDLDFQRMAHFDLLYPARRLFRQSLENCRLVTLEREVLGVRRGPDVDGSMIPALYFDYLRTRDARPLAPVLRHNVQDILSLATLLCRVVRTVEDPLRRAGGVELASAGEVHQRLGNSDVAVACLEAAVAGPMPLDAKRRALERLSLLYKERGERKDAVAAWEQLAGMPSPGVLPFEELAKHYEHAGKDLMLALRWTDRALHLPDLSAQDVVALSRRRERLASRLQGPSLF